jgi:hypothetical protein
MSPSINELFSAPGSEAEEDFELDMDKLMAGVDQSLAASNRFSTGEVETPEAPPEHPGEAAPVSPSEEPPPAQEEPSEPSPDDGGSPEVETAREPEESVSPPSDPLGLLFADAAKDPAKRDRLLAALADQKPEPETAPSLPDDIEEGTVAARLWHEQQRTQADLAAIAKAQRDQAEATERQRAVAAADQAGSEFAQKYAGRLDGDDVVRIAQAAGNSGLAARLATGTDDLKGAYLQALESTLWTTETLRNKVMEPAAPAELTVAQKDKEQSAPRKRKLTALSSSASPVSAPATPKSPLETRTDGRLTPQSRMSVVQEMATRLNRANNEGGY